MATAYVLIDFENVQPKELGAFGGGGFKVMVFVGAGQGSIPVGLASALQDLGHAGSYVHVAGRGPNALDMHIAYYIGRLAASDPGASFHIISRDRDYDPLIRQLQAQGIECTRWKSVAEINAAHVPAIVSPPVAARTPATRSTPKTTAAKTPRKTAAKATPKLAPKEVTRAAPKPVVSRIDDVIQNLNKRHRARPATTKALVSTIKSLYRDGITDKEVEAIVDDLTSRGVVTIDGDKVTYQFS